MKNKRKWYIAWALSGVVTFIAAIVYILEVMPEGPAGAFFSYAEIAMLIAAVAAVVFFIVGFHVSSQVVNDPKVEERMKGKRMKGER